MVTREMKDRGRVVAELEYDTYKKIIGVIQSNLPPHVYISPERVKKEGRKVVRLWCSHPRVGKEAVEIALSVASYE